MKWFDRRSAYYSMYGEVVNLQRDLNVALTTAKNETEKELLETLRTHLTRARATLGGLV